MFMVAINIKHLKGEKIMPGRRFQESESIRRWIKAALKAGCDSPRSVQEWIAQKAVIQAPSIPTIGNVMKEEGYKPAGFKWEKEEGK
jgi:hypothetical protein